MLLVLVLFGVVGVVGAVGSDTGVHNVYVHNVTTCKPE